MLLLLLQPAATAAGGGGGSASPSWPDGSHTPSTPSVALRSVRGTRTLTPDSCSRMLSACDGCPPASGCSTTTTATRTCVSCCSEQPGSSAPSSRCGWGGWGGWLVQPAGQSTRRIIGDGGMWQRAVQPTSGRAGGGEEQNGAQRRLEGGGWCPIVTPDLCVLRVTNARPLHILCSDLCAQQQHSLLLEHPLRRTPRR